MLCALVSAKPDVGEVTTSAAALALGSSRPVVLLDADMRGSSLRHGLLQHVRSPQGQALDGNTGLHCLPRADWAREADETLAPAVDRHLWPLDGSDSRFVLPGLTSPQQAASLGQMWPALISVLQLVDQQHGFDVVADGGQVVVDRGRLHPVLTPTMLLHQADAVLLVVRTTQASVALAQPAVQVLREELTDSGSGASALGLLVVDEGQYDPREVAEALEVPLRVHLPVEERAVTYLREGGRPPRGFAQSKMLRHARSYGDQLREEANRRRLHLQLDAARALSPQVAGVAQRLAQQRSGVSGRG